MTMGDFRKLLDIYKQVLMEHLTPSAILSRLTSWISDETFAAIVQIEHSHGPHKACSTLLSSLSDSCSPGIYRGFIDALRSEEFPFLADLLEGHANVRDVNNVFKNLLKIHYPLIYKDVDPRDILASLYQSGCITSVDRETVLAVYNSSGRPLATLRLLMIVVKQTESWFPSLMDAMRTGGYGHIVEEIEPQLLSAENMEDVERTADKIRETNITSLPSDEDRYAKLPLSPICTTSPALLPLQHSISYPFSGSMALDTVDGPVGGAVGGAVEFDGQNLPDKPVCDKLPPKRSQSHQPESSTVTHRNREQSETPTETFKEPESGRLPDQQECTEKWFHGYLSRENSEKIILDYGRKWGDGTFLVRCSFSGDHSYTLVVYMREEAYHVPIRCSQKQSGCLVLGTDLPEKQVYASLGHLINDYKQKGISLTTLGGQPLEGKVYLHASPPKTLAPLYHNLT